MSLARSPAETRIAIVGAGYFGRFHYDAWSRIEGCRLVGLCTRSGRGAGEVAAEFGVPATFTDLGAMLSETRPDLLDITAPSETHLQAIAIAAPAARWIVCQKPFCRDMAEAREAVRLAQAQGARVVVHENVRFQPWYREIRRLLDDGAVGEAYQVTFRLRPGDGQGADAYLDRQPYFREMPRFLVHETGIHWIDTFRYLLGEVTAVSADLRRLNPAIAGEDAGIVQFAFANGARGLFDANRLADHAAANRRLTLGEMELEGSAGTIRLDGSARITRRKHGASDWREHVYEWQDRHFGGDCVYLTNRATLTAFREGKPAETEADAYLRNLEIEAAVYRSHKERRWIDV